MSTTAVLFLKEDTGSLYSLLTGLSLFLKAPTRIGAFFIVDIYSVFAIFSPSLDPFGFQTTAKEVRRMKKTVIFILIFGMSLLMASFAQAKPSNISTGIGIDNGYTAFKFSTDDFMGSVGLVFSSSSGNSILGFSGKMAYSLSGGNIPTHAGGGIEFVSANNTSGFSIKALYGAETTFANKLNVGFDIYPFSYTSLTIGGTTSTSFTLGGGAVYAYLIF